MPKDGKRPQGSNLKPCPIQPRNESVGTIVAHSAGSVSSKREQALEYVRHGWALLPLRGKHPYRELLPKDHDGNPSWRLLADNPATEEQIRAWFECDPNINIGVICGKPSGGLVVADLDKPPPKSWHIPVTARSVTGRGEHLYFSSTDPVTSHKILNRGKVLGELQADGCYVVLPPSIHPSGSAYEWADLLSPEELNWDLAAPPEWALGSRYQTVKLISPSVETQRQLNGTATATEESNQLTGTVFKGTQLSRWFSQPETIRRILPILGLDDRYFPNNGRGKSFRCILPGHEERKPSASIYRLQSDVFVYHDWHGADGAEWYYLGEVYASQQTGRVQRFRAGHDTTNPQQERIRPELIQWSLRLLIEAGVAKPAPVKALELPASMPKSVHKVYDGFIRLLECKWMHTTDRPTAFSWRFAADWCGVNERTANKAIKTLLSTGYIQIVGQVPSSYGKSIAVFLPGTPELVKERAAAASKQKAEEG